MLGFSPAARGRRRRRRIWTFVDVVGAPLDLGRVVASGSAGAPVDRRRGRVGLPSQRHDVLDVAVLRVLGRTALVFERVVARPVARVCTHQWSAVWVQNMRRCSPRALPVVLAVRSARSVLRQPSDAVASRLLNQCKHKNRGAAQSLRACGFYHRSPLEVVQAFRRGTGQVGRRDAKKMATRAVAADVEARRLPRRSVTIPGRRCPEKGPPSLHGRKAPSPAAAPRRPRRARRRPARPPLQVRACRSSAV